jgi:hypothetical protein
MVAAKVQAIQGNSLKLRHPETTSDQHLPAKTTVSVNAMVEEPTPSMIAYEHCLATLSSMTSLSASRRCL